MTGWKRSSVYWGQRAGIFPHYLPLQRIVVLEQLLSQSFSVERHGSHINALDSMCYSLNVAWALNVCIRVAR